jgi:hypothetical protein
MDMDMDMGVEALAADPALAEATPAERLRFFHARKRDVAAASNMLSRYLEWRNRTLPLADDQPRFGVGAMPEWMIFHGKARDKSPIVHVQGAMYDQEVATPDQYANASAQLMDENLDRNSLQKISLLVDVRGDASWPCPKGRQFVPVIRSLSKILGDCFPERLQRLIIYPMPWTGMALWSAVKPFVDQTTAAKIVMLPGPSRPGAPCPVELGQYVEYEEIREDRRHRHTSLMQAADAVVGVDSSAPASASASSGGGDGGGSSDVTIMPRQHEGKENRSWWRQLFAKDNDAWKKQRKMG